MIGPAWLRWPWSAGSLLTAPSARCAGSPNRWLPAAHDGRSRPSSTATAHLVKASRSAQVARSGAGRAARSAGPGGGHGDAPRHRPGWGVGWVSDRAAAKATTHLNVALTHLEAAARLAREAGLPGQSGLLEGLAHEATEALAELQAAPLPTPPADQAAKP
jgi:hypothetical protein